MYPDALAEYVKHWVLDRAHPLPLALRVYPGTPGSLAYAVTRAVLARVALEGLEVRGTGGEEAALPTVWVADGGEEDGAAQREVAGLTAVARYLGRLWRLYPCNPASALHVDASLDLLARFAHAAAEADTPAALCAHVAAYASLLEARQEDAGHVWLEGMDKCSLADVCWAGVFAWARSVEAWDLFDAAALPNLAAWWEAVCATREEEEE